MTTTYKTCLLLLALVALSAGPSSAKTYNDNCDFKIKKGDVGDCGTLAGVKTPPEECRILPDDVLSGAQYQNKCMAQACAKVCKEKGGDEVLYYPESPFSQSYGDFFCCKSKTPEQTGAKKASCNLCMLVDGTAGSAVN